ncbi:MAG TPA: hypothetical protein VES19_02205 [Candidatus Limnocylindrales bacterium]|nr:hypothetical protein [Candidatus Limnocylindrales bacterium]
MNQPETTTLRGEARHADGVAAPATVVLAPEGFSIVIAGAPPIAAGYRDALAVTVDAGSVRVRLGAGAGAETWLLERFGTQTGALARGLREGRLRQRLTDGLVELDDGAEIDLVEYEAPGETGVGQLVYHDRGVVLAPVDERHAWKRVRRADIGAVTPEPAVGGLRVDSAGRSLPAGPGGAPSLRLVRMGTVATRHVQRWSALRDGAASDAAAIVSGLIPEASYGARGTAAACLLDGRPASAAMLGEVWAPLERAVLGVPPFDESYRILRGAGGGEAAPRWLAAAPERPGAPETPRLWFLVGLPGNLVAMELVSEGAHATYLFRVVPRALFGGSLPPGALEAAVADVSEALIDARFLREPIALPEAQLAEAEALRYRLALAALPSLAAARARFVARLVHRDAESWTAALRDVIAWHGAARDDAAEWPGRNAQESQIDQAAGPG